MKFRILYTSILSLLLLRTFSTATIHCRMNTTNEHYFTCDTDIEYCTNDNLDLKMSLMSQNLYHRIETKFNTLMVTEQVKQNLNRLEMKLSEMLRMQNIIENLSELMEQKFNDLMAATDKQNEMLSSISSRVLPSNCEEAIRKTHQSGVYKIAPSIAGLEWLNCRRTFKAYDGDWTVVMRRFNGAVDFYRNWTEYKHGFGNLDGEFFIGLEKLYELTSNGGSNKQLLIVMRDWEDTEIYAKYETFAIGNEGDGYVLKELGKYTGNATDSLRRQVGLRFSTRDVDNYPGDGNCANVYPGAWWFKTCHDNHLFGEYSTNQGASGRVAWSNYVTYTPYKLRMVEMFIKSAN